MKKELLFGLALLLGIVLGISGPALAVEIDFHTTYGASVPDYWYNGFVQWDYSAHYDDPWVPGISATGEWADDSTNLIWDITPNADGSYTYSYIWTTEDKDLSHIIIELTDGISLGDLRDLNTTPNASIIEPTTYSPGQNGNSDPDLPGELYGVKFELDDSLDFMFSFTTDHEPVWGNFYAKSGNGVYAYNTGFADSEDGVFIARPNGMSVPEPSTMLLLGVGLIGLAGIGRNKFVKQ